MEIFFIVQCVKKMLLRKKVENGTKKKGIKLAWHYLFYYLCKRRRNFKELYIYIITFKKDKNL